jgi:hypothetical protein
MNGMQFDPLKLFIMCRRDAELRSGLTQLWQLLREGGITPGIHSLTTRIDVQPTAAGDRHSEYLAFYHRQDIPEITSATAALGPAGETEIGNRATQVATTARTRPIEIRLEIAEWPTVLGGIGTAVSGAMKPNAL